MTRGKFIALEGGEGTGKSTQARKLAEALEKAGHVVVTTREPGGTPGAEAIRSLLLDPPGEGWGPKAEALLFAAARSDHVEKLILPSLDAGRWVVCDRFVDSSRAYQGFAGQLGDDKVRALHAVGSDGIRPDLVILIDVSPDEIARRLSVRDADGSDAIGGRSADYHARVAAAFRKMAEEDAAGFVVVDGNAGEETVHARILEAISGRFGDKL